MMKTLPQPLEKEDDFFTANLAVKSSKHATLLSMQLKRRFDAAKRSERLDELEKELFPECYQTLKH